MLSVPRGCPKSARSAAEEVREVWAEASSAEDPPGGIWASPPSSGAAVEDQDRYLRLLGLHAPVRNQPQGPVRGARGYDEEAPEAGAQSRRQLVSRASPRALGLPTAHAQRDAAWALPVLRAPDELPQSRQVPSGGARDLAYMARSPDAQRLALLAALHQTPRALPPVASAHHPRLDYSVNRARRTHCGNSARWDQ